MKSLVLAVFLGELSLSQAVNTQIAKDSFGPHRYMQAQSATTKKNSLKDWNVKNLKFMDDDEYVKDAPKGFHEHISFPDPGMDKIQRTEADK